MKKFVCRHCLEQSDEYFWNHPLYCPDPNPLSLEDFKANLDQDKLREYEQLMQSLASNPNTDPDIKEGAKEWIDRAIPFFI